MEQMDFERLLRAMYPHPDYEDNSLSIEELCRLHLGIGFDDFMRVGTALLPLTEPSKSPVTSSYYHAYLVDGVALVKLKSIL